MDNLTTWWGDFQIGIDQYIHIEIESFTLNIQRLEKEWNISYVHQPGLENKAGHWLVSSSKQSVNDEAKHKRFVFTHTHEALKVLPKLADRSVVVRPSIPMTLPSGQEVTLFVSTPLWVCLETLEPSVNLLDIYIQRPSDTWFGASTLEGELCYASKTQGRTSLDEIPFRPHRAITPIIIKNQVDSPFVIERINLPVSYLSLFSSLNNNFLWTQSVIMTRTPDTKMATMNIEDNPPSDSGETQLLTGPRQKPESPSLLRAFSSLFG